MLLNNLTKLPVKNIDDLFSRRGETFGTMRIEPSRFEVTAGIPGVLLSSN